MTASLTSPAGGQLARWLDEEVADDRDLTRAELRLLVGRIAGEQGLWRPYVRLDPHERYTVLLHRREQLDVWLLCWLDVQETGFHDHDRSAGALHVCEGTLVEDVLRFNSSSSLGTARRRLHAGTSRGFGVGHVHGVRHLGPEPATSIHVYSPALRGMGHYELGGGGVRRVHRSYDDGALEP
jgi:predicted metal-dependent enzyme (double-stranded beta helix superfamily)